MNSFEKDGHVFPTEFIILYHFRHEKLQLDMQDFLGFSQLCFAQIHDLSKKD